MWWFTLVTHVQFGGVTLILCSLAEWNTVFDNVPPHAYTSHHLLLLTLTDGEEELSQKQEGLSMCGFCTWMNISKYRISVYRTSSTFLIYKQQVELSAPQSFSMIYICTKKHIAHVHLWSLSFQKMLPYFKALHDILVAEKS